MFTHQEILLLAQLSGFDVKAAYGDTSMDAELDSPDAFVAVYVLCKQ